jgi:hypothetical protein
MNDDKGFLKLLSGAQKVEIEVTPAASKQQETLVYEVGGFDPSRWSQLDKRKK